MVAGGIGYLCLLPLGFGTAVLTAFAMALAALVLAGIAMRQIGGQTGDVDGRDAAGGRDRRLGDFWSQWFDPAPQQEGPQPEFHASNLIKYGK